MTGVNVPNGLGPLIAILAGAAVGGGLFLLFVAVRGLPHRPDSPPSGERLRRLGRFLSTRGAIAVIGGFAVLAVTRWPVAGVAAGLLILSWNGLFGGAAEERNAMLRLDALASWTESLRDTIAGAVGLEQAIPASTRAAAPSLRPHLQLLVDRLHTRTPLADALRRLADELKDPSADLVVAALILNSRLRGPGLRDLLGALSTAAREELDMRRRVEAERRSTRRSVQIVVGVTLGVMALLVIFNRDYVQAYDSFLGQLVLAVIAGMFALGFLWLRRLAHFDLPGRILAGVSSVSAPPEPDRHDPAARGRSHLAGGVRSP
ncbi:MAG: type II secretion system F family protein [Streptosporangiaceae bacterium]